MQMRFTFFSLILLSAGLFNCTGSSYEGTLRPINSAEYERYFILKGVSEDYIYDKIEEYGTMFPGQGEAYDFGFASANDWEIIRVDPDVNFYYYHNLICWFLGYGGQEEYPQESIGFALNPIDSPASYITYVDPNNSWGDTEIGLFDDGKEFFIYLPEAYEENGNLKVQTEKNTPFQNLEDYFETIDFDPDVLEGLPFEVKSIVLNGNNEI